MPRTVVDVDEAYQFRVFELAVALRVTVPGPHRLPAVVDVTTGVHNQFTVNVYSPREPLSLGPMPPKSR